MPVYYFACKACTKTFLRVLPRKKSSVTCKECGSEDTTRAPQPPSSHVVETIDTGNMSRAIERLADAPQLFHERSKNNH